MRATRTIVAAATITALSSLALPGHAGDGGQSGQTGGDAVIVTTVTEADCEYDGQGQVVEVETSPTGSRCQGGPFDGHAVSDEPL